MEDYNFKDLSFNDMPKALEFLIDKVVVMHEQLEAISHSICVTNCDSWMTIDDLSMYLPDKPAVQTIYAWVSQKLIPYNKVGKRLYFLKSDIDRWLKEGRRKTAAEIAIEASERFEKLHIHNTK